MKFKENKVKKYLVGIFSTLLVMTSATVGVAYATTAYYTTLTMTYNSTLEGAERYYDTGYYYIRICPSRFDSGSTSVDSYSAFKNWWGYSDEVGKTVELEKIGVTYLKYLGQASSGNRVYHFSTSGRQGFSSNSVTLSSGSGPS